MFPLSLAWKLHRTRWTAGTHLSVFIGERFDENIASVVDRLAEQIEYAVVVESHQLLEAIIETRAHLEAKHNFVFDSASCHSVKFAVVIVIVIVAMSVSAVVKASPHGYLLCLL